MKKSVIIVQLLLAFVYTGAQSTAGISGTRDTSYNITNEYNKHLKNYPNLQIVKEFSYPYIIEEKNIRLGTMGAHARYDSVDVIDGEHDATEA